MHVFIIIDVMTFMCIDILAQIGDKVCKGDNSFLISDPEIDNQEEISLRGK